MEPLEQRERVCWPFRQTSEVRLCEWLLQGWMELEYHKLCAS